MTKLRIALSVAAGILPVSLGYPVYTLKGALMVFAGCIFVVFVCNFIEGEK